MHDATRERFAKTAERVAALQDAARRSSRRRCCASSRRRVTSGCSTPAAARVPSPSPSLRTCARWSRSTSCRSCSSRAGAGLTRFPNVSFVEGDATKLPFELGAFDLAGSLRTLHHVARPELALAELVRVTRPGGRVLVIDQLAPIDPAAAAELNAFERARDPSTSRVLAEVDLRGLFESNGLVLLRSEQEREPRDLDAYLELAGCEGERAPARGVTRAQGLRRRARLVPARAR